MAKKRTSKEWSDHYRGLYESDRSDGLDDKLAILTSLREKKVRISNSLNPSNPQELTIKDVNREFDMETTRTMLKIQTELGAIDLRIPQNITVSGNKIILDYSKTKDSQSDWGGQQKMRKSGGRKYTKVSNIDELLITIELLEQNEESE